MQQGTVLVNLASEQRLGEFLEYLNDTKLKLDIRVRFGWHVERADLKSFLLRIRMTEAQSQGIE